MSTATITRPIVETLRDLLDRLGDIPLDRVRAHPAPGTATEDDVLVLLEGEKKLFELVDGVLVEKAMGLYESILAGILIGFLRAFLEEHNLGFVAGEAGAMRLLPGL